MKLGIMQPYFFPYIGYFQLIASVDKFMLYEHVSFRKKSWITRNYILPSKCAPMIISVPIRDKSSEKEIRDILIENESQWRSRLLKTILHAYKKAAFFDETFTLLERIMEKPQDYLYQFNAESLIGICKHLGINTEITYQHDNYRLIEEDLISKFENISANDCKDKPDRKSERIIKICQTECAAIYHNPPGGHDMYNKEIFQKFGIDLKFVMPVLSDYNQFNRHFTPNLSVIDVLMHCGKEQTFAMLNNYSLL